LDRDRRFTGAITLPYTPHPKLKIALIGTQIHCEQAAAIGIAYKDQEDLKKFNKDKKLVKKWAKPFDVLIASESLMKLIPRLLGNILVKIGKFPLTIQENEKVEEKVKELKNTVRFQLKKVLCMGTGIGNVDMTEEQIRQNLAKSVNFLISLLKKGWQNIKSLHIKTSMGPSHRIYG